MSRVTYIILILIVIISCNRNEIKDEVVDLALVETKISAIEGSIFDTIDFKRTVNGLNYVLTISDTNGIKPDTNSHVILDYMLLSDKGTVLIERDTSESVFQLYVKECSEPLAESICLLHLNSTIKVLIDGNSALPLFDGANGQENYLAKITLIDFHQHYD